MNFDCLVVGTPRCARGNPVSNPAYGKFWVISLDITYFDDYGKIHNHFF